MAVAYFGFINRHRVVSYTLIIGVGIGVFVFSWRSVSLTVAIIVVGLALVYGVVLAVVASVRLRRLRRRT